MKYARLLFFAAFLTVFAACSSDDDSLTDAQQTTTTDIQPASPSKAKSDSTGISVGGDDFTFDEPGDSSTTTGIKVPRI